MASLCHWVDWRPCDFSAGYVDRELAKTSSDPKRHTTAERFRFVVTLVSALPQHVEISDVVSHVEVVRVFACAISGPA